MDYNAPRRLLFSLTTAVLLGLGCSTAFIGTGFAADADEGSMKCGPRSIAPGQSLRIDMPSRHAGELAIVAPDGDYFFVAQRDVESSNASAIPSNLFEGISSLTISVDSFVAHRWRAGAVAYEPVFDKPGTYKVILGEPIESDATGNLQVCEVTFRK